MRVGDWYFLRLSEEHTDGTTLIYGKDKPSSRHSAMQTPNNAGFSSAEKDRKGSFDTMISKADALLTATDSILSDGDRTTLLEEGSSSSSSDGAISPSDKPSLKPVIFNLVNAVVGAGVLAQPFCFKEAGMVAAGLFLCSTALFTKWSLYMMAFVGEISHKKGYSEAVEHYYGSIGAMATDFS